MVELVKFRIKNYKSIIDSGDCYLANKITVLAGKNESGKSSILEALEDFDIKKEIRKSAIPIHDENSKPEIGITFHVEKSLINETMKKLGIDKIFDNDIEITVKKIFPKKYSLHEDSLSILSIDGSVRQEYII
jgi:AAA15 family ATPase/GTPase